MASSTAFLDQKKLGQIIRDARDAHGGRGLTVRELAAVTGITEAVITSYETGARQPTLLNLWKLATVLSIDLNALRTSTMALSSPDEHHRKDAPESSVEARPDA